MSKIISIHEYQLKPNVTPQAFEQAIRQAEADGLFDLPGLEAYHFIFGVKGKRRGQYAAIWIYESRAAWEKLWGPPDKSLGPQNYPPKWQVWENEVLAPLLDRHPDQIN